MLLDRQCEAISSTVSQFGHRKLVAEAYRTRSAELLQTAFQDLNVSLPEVDFVVGYGLDGLPLSKGVRSTLAPRNLLHVLRELSQGLESAKTRNQPNIQHPTGHYSPKSYLIPKSA